jgi:glycerol-3-phosphate acyltransferase PlsX
MDGEERVRIAIDAMGGDRAPEVVVQAAEEALKEIHAEFILVGHKERLKDLLKKYGLTQRVKVHHAEEVIEGEEQPTTAVKAKPCSSIVECVKLLKCREADALVSAGHTGAVMAAALLYLGKLKGVQRPAIVVRVPTKSGSCILLDVGANVDCRPLHLFQFALMGQAYARSMLHCPNPRVGILSIGEEKTKGNEVVLKAHSLLEKASINFVGNVEGRDIMDARVDVVVCDGFVGNVLLKFGEGFVQMIKGYLSEAFKENILRRCAGLLLKDILKDAMKKLDYTEYGGAPLLGVKGVCIICHGISSSKAIKNALKVAIEAKREKLIERIEESLKTRRWEMQAL